MFELKMETSKLFKGLIDTISALICDGTLHIGEDGISLIAIERSRIAMIDFFISKDAFTSYDIKDEIDLNLNFEDVSKFIKSVGDDDEFTMSIIEDRNIVEIKFKGKSTRTFGIPLLEAVSCESMEKPSISTEVKFHISSEVLQKAIKDSRLVADTMSFKSTEDGELSAEAKSDRGSLEIDFKEEAKVDGISPEQISQYSISMLEKMIKGGSLAKEGVLAFSTDNPIVLAFPIGDLGEISYSLAPQVEEEQESSENTDENEDVNDQNL
jgi:proliferating cell nuclear antigen